MAARRGDHARAAEFHHEALIEVAPLGIYEDVPAMQVRYAHELWLLGERGRALSALDEAQETADRLGVDECLAAVAYEFGEILRAYGELAQARVRLERTRSLASFLTMAPQLRAMIVSSIGYRDAAEGDLTAPRARQHEALELALESRDAPVIGQVVVGFADLALRHGRPAGAAELLGASVAVRSAPDLSLFDAARVEAAACAALGEANFAEAYARGRTVTVADVRELVGLTLDA